MKAIFIICGFIFGFYPVLAEAKTNFDLEATEVICHRTEKGERYFSYVISNVGENTAESGTYSVYLVVNRKIISLDRNTSDLEAGKSIRYNSEYKFDQKKKGKKLKYKLIIQSEDANKTNNKKKGIIL